jgi:hypothetical protein
LEYGTVTPISSAPTLWSLGAAVNTRLHFSESFALIPFVQVHSEDALMKRLYAEDPRRPVGDEHYRFVAPVGVEIDKQFGPNSNMTISYAYHGLGRAEAFHLNVFGIGFTWFW